MSPQNNLPNGWDELIGWIQQRLCINGFDHEYFNSRKASRNNVWTEEHSNTVVDFLSNTSSRKLLVAYDPSRKNSHQWITLSTDTIPFEVLQNVDEIAYFIRSDSYSKQVLSISNIGSIVHYGTVASRQTPHSVKEAMYKIYWPQIKSSLGERLNGNDVAGRKSI